MDGIDIRKHRKLKDLVINNVIDEAGYIHIYGKDIDVLKLGDATHEGGDVKIYRDSSGNLQLYVDADAASNAIGMSVYGGGVFQNYLTVGQETLNTTYRLYVADKVFFAGIVRTNSGYRGNYVKSFSDNLASFPISIYVTGTDATDHAIKLQIDENDIIVAQATGDGSGGIINKAIGLFGVTPQVQQAHIADVAAAAGDPPTKAEFDAFATKFNTLLADLEGYGHLKIS